MSPPPLEHWVVPYEYIYVQFTNKGVLMYIVKMVPHLAF